LRRKYLVWRCALVCERLRCEPWRPWGWWATTRGLRRPARRGVGFTRHWHLKSLVPRRAVLPSLPWVVRFLSFCHWHYHRYTKKIKKRYVMTLRVLDG